MQPSSLYDLIPVIIIIIQSASLGWGLRARRGKKGVFRKVWILGITQEIRSRRSVDISGCQDFSPGPTPVLECQRDNLSASANGVPLYEHQWRKKSSLISSPVIDPPTDRSANAKGSEGKQQRDPSRVPQKPCTTRAATRLRRATGPASHPASPPDPTQACG